MAPPQGGPNGGLSLKERGFIALSWIPKATVQAALASTPLDMVMRAFPEGHPHHDAYVKYARDVLATAVLSIILVRSHLRNTALQHASDAVADHRTLPCPQTAPLGLVLLNGLGPRWLTRTANPAHGQGREKSAARERSARPALPSAPTAPPTPPPLDVPQSLLRDADALARLVTDDPDCAPVRRALLSLAHVARRQPRPEDAWDVLAACRGVLAGVRRARADAEAALRPRLALDLDTIGNFFALVGGASGGARIDVEPARGIYGMPNTRGSSEGQGDPRMDAWSEADLEAGSEPWADLEGLSRKGSEGGCTPRLAAQGLEQRSARVDIPCSDGLQLVPLDRRGKDEGPCAEADQASDGQRVRDNLPGSVLQRVAQGLFPLHLRRIRSPHPGKVGMGRTELGSSDGRRGCRSCILTGLAQARTRVHIHTTMIRVSLFMRWHSTHPHSMPCGWGFLLSSPSKLRQSILAARMKSFSDSPPTACVDKSTRSML